jgi:O-glycosyl hydrolase
MLGLLLFVGLTPAYAQASPQPVIPSDALLTTPVGGLSSTNATTQVLPVTGQPFSRELSVTIRAGSDQTNATQLTMPISAPVQKSDVLLASFYVRGSASSGKPGHVELLFERATDPWTKSVIHDALANKNPATWSRIVVPFQASESYQPGEAMVSLRLAFGPQTVEVGGLAVLDYGNTKTLADLEDLAAQMSPIGDAHVTVNLADTRQTLAGFGGDFCQPRYGSSDALDAVGQYTLAHLNVAQARIGIPLNYWTPQRGVYKDDGPAHAALLQMQEMAKRKIPIIGTIWEGPTWLLPGKPEQSGRILDPSEYSDCIDAIIQFLTIARDKYGADVAYFSFNEADYGVNFKFTPATIDNFIKQAGPRFQAAGLKTKFLVGDTGGGVQFPAYVRPLLADKTVAPYLGALAFHCWDSLSASDDQYEEIAQVAKEAGKPVWATEVGWDSGLWQRPDPWGSWDNALNTALAYIKTLRLSGASVMDYWTYENNYPIVDPNTVRPYSVFNVINQIQDALPAGAKVASASTVSQDLSVLASAGPKPEQFSILIVNPTGQGTVTLTTLPPHATVRILLSDNRPQDAPEASLQTDAYGSLKVAIPPRSVVSLIGSR